MKFESMTDDYEPDTFYNTKHLSLEDKRNLLLEAKECSDKWWVDILKSTQRKKIEMDFETILEKLDDDSHYVFIHRRGFKSRSGKPLTFCEYALEIGFSTMNAPSYFLFIYCDLKYLQNFIGKYNLTKLK